MNAPDTSPSPYLFGIEWEHDLQQGILDNLSKFSCIEFIPENFVEGTFQEFLKALAKAGTPVSVHGVHLSIGSMEPLKEKHLENMLEIASDVNMIYFSEHLALTEVGGYDMDALTPVAFTEEMADAICRKIELIQSRLSVPFLIENVANRFYVPDGDFSETNFINRILQKSGCGLLLDITNIYTNSVNFGFDPYRWIDAIDLSKVKEIHLAGGFYDPEGFLMDTHDNEVCEESWSLYHYAASKAPPFVTIIERTSNFPHISALADEIDRAQRIIETPSLAVGVQ